MGQAKSLSAASLGEDLKGINQQKNAKHTTETILEETAEPLADSAFRASAPCEEEGIELHTYCDPLSQSVGTHASHLHLGHPRVAAGSY